MSRRSRPHYRPGLGWILGVAFGNTLTRPVRLAQRFTCVRCCGSPRASSPHGLTAPALASHDGSHCVQLPPARGCYQLAPQRTFTSNPVPMPGTPTQGHGASETCPSTGSDATYRNRNAVARNRATSLIEVKRPEESKNPWDLYRIVATIPGEQAFRPLHEGGCPLVRQ